MIFERKIEKQIVDLLQQETTKSILLLRARQIGKITLIQKTEME